MTERTVCRFTLLFSSSDNRRFPTSTFLVFKRHRWTKLFGRRHRFGSFLLYLSALDFLIVYIQYPKTLENDPQYRRSPTPSLPLTKLFLLSKSQHNTTEYKLRFLRTQTTTLKQNFSLVFLTNILGFCLRVPLNDLAAVCFCNHATHKRFISLFGSSENWRKEEEKDSLQFFFFNFSIQLKIKK